MSEVHDRIHFIGKPNNDGPMLYGGVPCPTSEVLHLIGHEGVNYIDQRLKEIVKWKRHIYGRAIRDKAGLSRLVQFADYDSCSILRIGQTIAEINHDNPEKNISLILENKELTEINSEILRGIDHYLIQVYGVLDENSFHSYIAELSG